MRPLAGRRRRTLRRATDSRLARLAALLVRRLTEMGGGPSVPDAERDAVPLLEPPAAVSRSTLARFLCVGGAAATGTGSSSVTVTTGDTSGLAALSVPSMVAGAAEGGAAAGRRCRYATMAKASTSSVLQSTARARATLFSPRDRRCVLPSAAIPSAMPRTACRRLAPAPVCSRACRSGPCGRQRRTGRGSGACSGRHRWAPRVCVRSGRRRRDGYGRCPARDLVTAWRSPAPVALLRNACLLHTVPRRRSCPAPEGVASRRTPPGASSACVVGLRRRRRRCVLLKTSVSSQAHRRVRLLHYFTHALTHALTYTHSPGSVTASSAASSSVFLVGALATGHAHRTPPATGQRTA